MSIFAEDHSLTVQGVPNMLPPEAAEYRVLWDVLAQRFPYLDDADRAWIISLMLNICTDCYESFDSCECWNDQ